jgi:hypothetical protein
MADELFRRSYSNKMKRPTVLRRETLGLEDSIRPSALLAILYGSKKE